MDTERGDRGGRMDRERPSEKVKDISSAQNLQSLISELGIAIEGDKNNKSMMKAIKNHFRDKTN